MSLQSSPSVVIVTMAFPAPSEAFAGVEVRNLIKAGADVVVQALRPPHRMTTRLVNDQQLDGVAITHMNAGTPFRALLFACRHPVMVAATLLWLIRHGWRSPLHFVRGFALLPRCLEVFAHCLRRPPDVVHLFWGHYPATVGYMARRWLPGTHVSTSLGAYDLLLEYEPGVDVARHADSVWTQADCNRAALLAAGIDQARLHVLIRGVDREQVSGCESGHRVPAQVVAVARLEPNKGLDDVLRAFALAAADRPGARLAIVGEGSELRALQELAASLRIDERTEFHGALPHSRVIQILAESEVFMLLSRNPSERLPNALKEAMACGCICIVTRTPGIEEIAGAWSKPCVVEQGDWRAAAAHLREAFRDPAAWEQDRQAARRYVLDNLDARSAARHRLWVWTGDRTRSCAA